MRKKLKWVALLAACAIVLLYSSKARFWLGGAMLNIGYQLQDPIESYDLDHHEVSPQQVWEEFLSQNKLASTVRHWWPRSTRHPVIAMVTCMDARLDTNEIAGDTRHYYYILRLAGSVLSVKEEEMLELAVANGVKVVVFTTHTDCAAEKVAADSKLRGQYPNLSQAIDERSTRFSEFLGRPAIRAKMQSGALLAKWVDLDTSDEHVMPHVEKAAAPSGGAGGPSTTTH